MKLLAVIVAALGEKLYGNHAAAPFWKDLSTERIDSLFPALTCPAQATFRTALPVSGHGMVTSGYYDRTLKKPFFWEQSTHLYEGRRIWEDFRRDGGKVAQICLQQCPGLDSDFYLSPAPVHKHHGGMIQEFFCEPPELYHELCRETGAKFNLMNYWGPFTSRKSSDWIAGATRGLLKRLSHEKDAFILTYIPNLDYDLQRRGPETSSVAKAFSETEEILSSLYRSAKENGFELLLCGDYEITSVNRVVYPNRLLMEHGFLRVRDVRGMLYQNLHSSTAFALVDHQLAHIYCDRTEDIPVLKALFEKLPGVGRVLESAAEPSLSHPRSGELILEAEEGAWFAYKWWNDDSQAPDYATHVDIHNKPGFDPCEVFMTLWPPMGTPLDCTRVKGSHGRAGNKVVCASSFPLNSTATSFLNLAESVKNLLNAN